MMFRGKEKMPTLDPDFKNKTRGEKMKYLRLSMWILRIRKIIIRAASEIYIELYGRGCGYIQISLESIQLRSQ